MITIGRHYSGEVKKRMGKYRIKKYAPTEVNGVLVYPHMGCLSKKYIFRKRNWGFLETKEFIKRPLDAPNARDTAMNVFLDFLIMMMDDVIEEGAVYKVPMHKPNKGLLYVRPESRPEKKGGHIRDRENTKWKPFLEVTKNYKRRRFRVIIPEYLYRKMLERWHDNIYMANHRGFDFDAVI